MSMEPPTLLDMLVNDLDHNFVKSLISAVSQIYPNSYQALMSDANLGQDQALYTLGYLRRGYAETALFQTAVKHGLPFKNVQPQGGGCEHIHVSVGRFGLVICHVLTPDAFPQHSNDRKQSSAVNDYFSQMSLFPLDPPPLTDELFGILIHTEAPGRKDTFSSLKIGFPNAEFDGWVAPPISLSEIFNIQEHSLELTVDYQGQVQDPQPVWKKSAMLDKASNASE